jgi:hypothetical protein
VKEEIMRENRIVGVTKILVVVTIVVAGFGPAVKYLWNWLMPGLFGLPSISFWQALGLLALSRLLFGEWGGGYGYRPASRRRPAELWEKMTPEEREKFRQGIWKRGCRDSQAQTL